MSIPSKQGLLAIASLALAAGLSGCGETAASNNFKGEQHQVAARITAFQKHATEVNEKKICSEDFASGLVARIREAGRRESGKGCTETVKEQLKSLDDPTLSIQSVTVHGTSATATVKSVKYGKTKPYTLMLVKEGEHWKIAGL
jgi:hypothetical protein